MKEHKNKSITDNFENKKYIESPENISGKIFENLEWLTTAEAAHYLRKSKDAIRQMVCRGHLRARKFRRRLYFKKVELNELLDISFY